MLGEIKIAQLCFLRRLKKMGIPGNLDMVS